ncbi:DNA-binding transcriptional regulator, MarR family [Lentibacillus persicus]|uniref:DNA-binding transcriptional regulator, MarR family n=2 Tax=Lentibacillus persicus TaxID=640948 RepID=A0A1I1TKC2_9BACI|nr:DNA-binding transcriptional regulator, MarR family [Lentibacillus persicus]
MKEQIPEETIANLEKQLRYISGMIKQNGRKILNHYPITSPQFLALQFLVDGDLTIGELSNKNGLAFSTTTDLVDRLEKNDLVERVKDESDRRVVRIHILSKGRTIIEEVIQKRQQYLGNVLGNFSVEQTETLNEMLTYLYEEMHHLKHN